MCNIAKFLQFVFNAFPKMCHLKRKIIHVDAVAIYRAVSKQYNILRNHLNRIKIWNLPHKSSAIRSQVIFFQICGGSKIEVLGSANIRPKQRDSMNLILTATCKYRRIV